MKGNHADFDTEWLQFQEMYQRYGVRENAGLIRKFLQELEHKPLANQLYDRKVRSIQLIEQTDKHRYATIPWKALLHYESGAAGFDILVDDKDSMDEKLISVGHEICHTFFSELREGRSKRIANAPVTDREQEVCETFGRWWVATGGISIAILRTILKHLEKGPRRTWWVP